MRTLKGQVLEVVVILGGLSLMVVVLVVLVVDVGKYR